MNVRNALSIEAVLNPAEEQLNHEEYIRRVICDKITDANVDSSQSNQNGWGMTDVTFPVIAPNFSGSM